MSSRRGHWLALSGFAVLATLLVSLIGPAHADKTVAGDPKGDAKGCAGPHVDIREATAGHTPRGRLKHTVRVQRAKAWAPPLIAIRVGRSKRIRYTVWGGFGNPTVVDNETSKSTGDVSVKRRRNRWVLVFDASALGDPKAYRWAAFTYPGGDCPNSDWAPNQRKGFRVHRLR